jgi:hypothetical protein
MRVALRSLRPVGAASPGTWGAAANALPPGAPFAPSLHFHCENESCTGSFKVGMFCLGLYQHSDLHWFQSMHRTGVQITWCANLQLRAVQRMSNARQQVMYADLAALVCTASALVQ